MVHVHRLLGSQQNSIKNRYPLPRIYELINSLKCDNFFMKLDLKSGYHQISIKSTNVWKMDFKTKERLFEWLVMPFGLTNALATFMRYMDDLLWNFIGKCVIVYLDNILIFSLSWEEHVKQLNKSLTLSSNIGYIWTCKNAQLWWPASSILGM